MAAGLGSAAPGGALSVRAFFLRAGGGSSSSSSPSPAAGGGALNKGFRAMSFSSSHSRPVAGALAALTALSAALDAAGGLGSRGRLAATVSAGSTLRLLFYCTPHNRFEDMRATQQLRYFAGHGRAGGGLVSLARGGGQQRRMRTAHTHMRARRAALFLVE